MPELVQGAEYLVQDVLGTGQHLVGHRVILVDVLTDQDKRVNGWDLVRVRQADRPALGHWRILARLRRTSEAPCQCPRLPFPHRKDSTCLVDQH